MAGNCMSPLLPLILGTLDLAPVVRTARMIAGGPPLGNDALGNLRRSACIEGLQKWKRTRWGILVLFKGSECFGEQTAYLIGPRYLSPDDPSAEVTFR